MFRREKPEEVLARILTSADSNVEDIKMVFSVRDRFTKALYVASTATLILYSVLKLAHLENTAFVFYLPLMFIVVFVLDVQPTEEERRRSAVYSKWAVIGSGIAGAFANAGGIQQLLATVFRALADGKITAQEVKEIVSAVKTLFLNGGGARELQKLANQIANATGMSPQQIAEIITGGTAATLYGAGKVSERKSEK